MGLRYLRMRPTVARIMDDRILPNVNKRTGWNDALHFTVRQSRRECFRFSTTGISAGSERILYRKEQSNGEIYLRK